MLSRMRRASGTSPLSDMADCGDRPFMSLAMAYAFPIVLRRSKA